MSYTLTEIKLAAYNRKELPDLEPNEAALWQGLAYCYDWNRVHPGEQTAECKALAEKYIDWFWKKQKLREVGNNGLP